MNNIKTPEKHQLNQSDLMMDNEQVWYCVKLGHEGNQLNIVCKYQDCPFKGLICASCLLKEHQSHINYCVPVNDVLGKTLTSSRVLMQQQTQSQIISTSQNLSPDSQKTILQLQEIQQQNNEFIKQIKTNNEMIEKHFQKLEQLCLTRAEDIKKLIKCKEASIKLEQGNISNRRELEEIIMTMAETDKSQNDITKPSQIITQFLKKRQDFLQKLFSDMYQDIFQNIEKNMKEALRTIRMSPNRFKSPVSCDNWGYAQSKLDAICFTQMCEETINFCGFAFNEITKWPDSGDKVELIVSIYEHDQDVLKEKFKEIIALQQGKVVFENKLCSIFFSKAVILNPRKLYSISIHSNQYFTTYAGSVGENEVDIFTFENSRLSTNGTDIGKGIFPSFIYF